MEELWFWLGIALVLLATVVAIRGTVRFDVNEWMRDRRKQKEENLRLLCPHVTMLKNGEEIAWRPNYVSPFGTLDWQCQRCGRVTNDEQEIKEIVRYWAAHPEEYLERNKKMARLAKKLGRG